MARHELDSAPGTGRLLLRAALGSLPLGRLLLGSLPVSGSPAVGSPVSGRRGDTLPDTELVLPSVRVDAEHVAAYSRVCGFGIRDELPATYPHVLAFPLAMQLMTDRSFPFPTIGSVHVANRITLYRPLRLTDTFTLSVRCVDLRPHERGRQFDVVHEATVDGDLVWRDTSTYLRRSPTPGAPEGQHASATPSTGHAKGQHASATPSTEQSGAGSARWRVGQDVGRRYASVSGDRNPIHLYALTARMLGFPRAIAHGMWTKARCLAALEGRLPESYTVDVAFKLPVLLPATVAFGATRRDGWEFWLRDARSGRPHLTGTVVPGPS
jgi:acyl dehydratase